MQPRAYTHTSSRAAFDMPLADRPQLFLNRCRRWRHYREWRRRWSSPPVGEWRTADRYQHYAVQRMNRQLMITHPLRGTPVQHQGSPGGGRACRSRGCPRAPMQRPGGDGRARARAC